VVSGSRCSVTYARISSTARTKPCAAAACCWCALSTYNCASAFAALVNSLLSTDGGCGGPSSPPRCIGEVARRIFANCRPLPSSV